MRPRISPKCCYQLKYFRVVLRDPPLVPQCKTVARTICKQVLSTGCLEVAASRLYRARYSL